MTAAPNEETDVKTTSEDSGDTPDFDTMTNAEILSFIEDKAREEDEDDDETGGFYTAEDLDAMPVLRDMFVDMLKREHGIPVDDSDES